jgi:hypothetical protein
MLLGVAEYVLYEGFCENENEWEEDNVKIGRS